VPGDAGTLTFLADSNAAITKGIIALVLATVQGVRLPKWRIWISPGRWSL
jgi:sulfur transfer protein SufE